MKLLPVVSLLLALAAPALGEEPALPPSVQRALDVRKVPHDSLSIYVQDLGSDEVLLEWLAAEPRNPASTIKLLTTLVALDLLGPAYTWRTDVYALGTIAERRLDGDLLIRGSGDPFLVTERVWQLLRRVRHAGIDEIAGDLLLDDSYFAVAPENPAAFDRQPLRAYNVAPHALLMNFKVVRYWFEPDHAASQVRIRPDPPLHNLQLENRLALAAGSCRGYQRGISIHGNDSLDRMIFSGRFPSGCALYAMDRTALHHNEYVYGLFTYLWRESGGRFDGDWRRQQVPEDAEPLVAFDSIPLAEVIKRINKYSNNVMARQLLYTLAAEEHGVPATEQAGRQVVTDWLRRRNLSFDALALDNGSGLSRDARVTACDLGLMLRFAWRQPYMPEYVASLSLTGHDGTLRRRFEHPALRGQAHMKTGSLDHVTAVAGYLQSQSGRRFAVAILQNHTDIHRGPGSEVQEAVLRWLHQQ